MVVAEAPGGTARLTRDMPLLAEFPTCQVTPNDTCCTKLPRPLSHTLILQIFQETV